MVDPASERVRLKDGSEVEIRPIQPSDAEPLEVGLEALSDDSTYRRFLTPKTGFSRRELEYLTRVDHRTHEALVAYQSDTDHGVGVARFIKDPADPETAEIGIVVIDDWQNRGLGSALLHRLAARAAEEDVQRFSAVVLESNPDVVALLRKVGPVESEHAGSGVAQLRVELPEAEPCPPVLNEALRAAARGELTLAELYFDLTLKTTTSLIAAALRLWGWWPRSARG